MASRVPPRELLELEVRELTDLLRHEDSSANIRDLLAANGMTVSTTILAGLIDGEDGSRYGVILTASRECVLFEMAPDDALLRWETIEDPDTLASSFEAVSVGISMVRSGQIS
jgi:hypothetical protein